MASLTDIYTSILTGIQSLNSLNQTISKAFPSVTATSTSVTAGTITFTSSQAAGFMVVTTSSGAAVKLPFYNL